MPKLAANLSMMFNEVDMMDRFAAAAQAGFKGVEYLFPYEFVAADLKEALDSNGLEQVLFDFPAGDWGEGERGITIMPERVSEFRDGVGSACEYAKALGCTRITALAGKIPDGAPPVALQDTLIENLQYAADEAAKVGATVMVEAINTRDIPGFFVNRTNHALQVITQVNRPNVKLQYDIYHMQIMEGDVAIAMETNKDAIGHLQLADNPGRHEPGTGELNYDFLLPYIDSIGYDGWIGCEYIPAGDTVEGLGWTEKYL